MAFTEAGNCMVCMSALRTGSRQIEHLRGDLVLLRAAIPLGQSWHLVQGLDLEHGHASLCVWRFTRYGGGILSDNLQSV